MKKGSFVPKNVPGVGWSGGEMGHVGVGWGGYMQGWGGHAGWGELCRGGWGVLCRVGGSCRGGVDHAGVCESCRGGVGHVGVGWII